MKSKQLLYGIASYVPGLIDHLAKGTSGTNSAEYCYSVWLRHLVMAEQNGLDTWPKVVAELGPGDSLGIGLAALISGCDKYFAFDIVEHSDIERNLKVFDDLVLLFKQRTRIPGNERFPKVKPYLDYYKFPASVLNESRLTFALASERLEKIRDSIKHPHNNDSLVQYKVPWNETSLQHKEPVDMIYSQAVLEHIDDLHNAYKSMRMWLKPTGYISHQIDFKCHETANEWNGHWAHSDRMWKLIRGKRPYLLNREPHSTHLNILAEEGFKVICDVQNKSQSKYSPGQLAPQFKTLSEDDLTTSGAFIQAVKIN